MSTRRKSRKSSDSSGANATATTFVHAPDTQSRTHELLALHALLSRNIPDDGIDHVAKATARERAMDSRTGRLLPGSLEREIADYFAFLAGSGAAVCLETAGEGSILMRLALGEGPVSNSVLGSLGTFCGLLRGVAAEGHQQSEITARTTVWHNVLTFEAPRVHRELTKKFTKTQRPLTELFEMVLTLPRNGVASPPISQPSSAPISVSDATTTASMLNDPRSVLQLIYDQCRQVVQQPVEDCIAEVERLLDTCYLARRSKSFKNYLKTLRPRKQIIQTIEKLGRHKAATFALVSAARTNSSVFRNLEIAAVSPLPRGSTYPPIQPASASVLNLASEIGGIPLPETLQKLLTATGLDSQKLYSKFRELCETSSIYVHPEMQLVRFYEENPGLAQPAFIGCSKKACYLCMIFLELHGKFGFSRSHQTLHHDWAIPRIRCAAPEESKRLHSIMEEMVKVLETACRNALRKYDVNSLGVSLPNQPTQSLPSLPVLAPQTTNGVKSSSSSPLKATYSADVLGKDNPYNGIVDSPTMLSPSTSRIPVAQASRDSGNLNVPRRSPAGQRSQSIPLNTIPTPESATPPTPKKVPGPPISPMPPLPASPQANARMNGATKPSRPRRTNTLSSIESEDAGVSLLRNAQARQKSAMQNASVQAPTASTLGITTRDVGVSPPGTLLSSRSGRLNTGVTSMAVHISNERGPPIELEARASTPMSFKNIKSVNSDVGPSELADTALTPKEVREQHRVEKGKWAAPLEDSPTVPFDNWLKHPHPNPAEPASVPAETEYTLYLAGHYTEGLSLGDEVFSDKLSNFFKKNKEREPVQCKGFRLTTELRPRNDGEKLLGRRLSTKEAPALRAHEVSRNKDGMVVDIVFADAIMRLNVMWDEKR